jgi:hypothetical protein
MYCDTIAIGNPLYESELIRGQLATNWFLLPLASQYALSYRHWVRNGLTIEANDRSYNFTILHWSQIYRSLPLSFLPYIEFRVSCTTQDAWIPSPIRHKAIRCSWSNSWFVQVHSVNWTPIYRLPVTGSSFISVWISQHGIMLWCSWHLISREMNHWSVSKYWFVWWLGIRYPADKEEPLRMEDLWPILIHR